MDVKDIIKKAEELGIDVDKLTKEAKQYVIDNLKTFLEEIQEDRVAYIKELDGMSNDELKLFVPDVYQEDIYKIDYDKLRTQGIKLLSFDIDDTIDDSIIDKVEAGVPGLKVSMPTRAKELFRELKHMGFTVVLVTNSTRALAEGACKSLKADGFIAKANKPGTNCFEELEAEYKFDKSQMAHIGNEIRQDVLGGNKFGITTCLVRRAGYINKLLNSAVQKAGRPTKSQLLKEELKRQEIWHKLHQDHPGDQYYQLGENQESAASKPQVAIVYDGKAPWIAAEKLRIYIRRMGYSVGLEDYDSYKKREIKKSDISKEYDKFIVIGHHDFAKDILNSVGTSYNSFGMSFGYSDKECALLASRKALGSGKNGRSKFEAYYNDRILLHKELVEEYGVPMQFGTRDETRKSQYDLLWLEFVKYGLTEFLGLPDRELSNDVLPEQDEVKEEG